MVSHETTSNLSGFRANASALSEIIVYWKRTDGRENDARRVLRTMSTRPGPTPEERPSFRLFQPEREFLAQNWEQLRTTYGGRYVAVLGTSILDSDRDFSALATRVYDRFGYRRIFMPFIGQPERVYRIPSPRLVK